MIVIRVYKGGFLCHPNALTTCNIVLFCCWFIYSGTGLRFVQRNGNGPGGGPVKCAGTALGIGQFDSVYVLLDKSVIAGNTSEAGTSTVSLSYDPYISINHSFAIQNLNIIIIAMKLGLCFYVEFIFHTCIMRHTALTHTFASMILVNIHLEPHCHVEIPKNKKIVHKNKIKKIKTY